MIITVDHIAFCCNIKEIDTVMHYFAGYEMIFREKVKNIELKTKFMNETQEDHMLIYLKKKKSIPIEITAYEKVNSSNYFNVINFDFERKIDIFSPDIIETKNLFFAMGFRVLEEDACFVRMCIKPLLDESIFVTIKENLNNDQWKLDKEGFCCIAFVVKNAVEFRKMLLMQNFNCTKLEQLEINQKKWMVFFIEGRAGECIEILCPKR